MRALVWSIARQAHSTPDRGRAAILAARMRRLDRAGSTAGPDVAAHLQQVSGGSGDGTKCTTYAECADIIIGGGVADYDGVSGPITFNEVGDPTEATIGIFQFDDKNNNSFVRIG
mgnify:CR=1 FL=1